MRLPFLRSKSRPDAAPAPARAAAAKAERARDPAVGGESGELEVARTRARRRLVGAVVLLVIGIVGFPMLFETQPRPLPLDTPIELPRREGTAPAPGAARSRAAPSLPADAGTETAADLPANAPARPAPAPLPQAAPAVANASPPAAASPAAPVPVAAASAPAPAAVPRAATAEPRADDAARARALLEGTASAPVARNFIVQVGAYSDAATLREARAKVEKLGLKTYTQVVETDGVKLTRVRLGPFATREEADAAAAKVKRTGLRVSILTR